jgi:hypothetical protein
VLLFVSTGASDWLLLMLPAEAIKADA